MIKVTFSFAVSTTLLPKAIVVQHPLEPSTVQPVYVSVPVLGLKSGDEVSDFTISPPNSVTVSSVNDGSLVIANSSHTVDATISRNFTVSRYVELFTSHSVMSDTDGYVTVDHNLPYVPTKWLATASVSSDQSAVSMCFVMCGPSTITLRAFVGTAPLASSPVHFSLYVG